MEDDNQNKLEAKKITNENNYQNNENMDNKKVELQQDINNNIGKKENGKGVKEIEINNNKKTDEKIEENKENKRIQLNNIEQKNETKETDIKNENKNNDIQNMDIKNENKNNETQKMDVNNENKNNDIQNMDVKNENKNDDIQNMDANNENKNDETQNMDVKNENKNNDIQNMDVKNENKNNETQNMDVKNENKNNETQNMDVNNKNKNDDTKTETKDKIEPEHFNNYIYFTCIKKNEETTLSLPENYGNNLELINENNKKISEDPKTSIYRFKINQKYFKDNNNNINIIIKHQQENNIFNIKLNNEDINKDLYIYNFKSKLISQLKIKNQFHNYLELLKEKYKKEKTSKEFEDFIYSTEKIFENRKTFDSFYISVFLECYTTKFAKKHLELFNYEEIDKIPNKKKNVFNNEFNNLIKEPNKLYIENENENERQRVNELLFSMILLYNIFFQRDKINEMLDNTKYSDYLYQKYISFIGHKDYKFEYFTLSKIHISNLLKKVINEKQFKNILLLLGENIPKILEAINEQKNDIRKILIEKNFKAPIMIDEDYIKPNINDDIKFIFNQINQLNETGNINIIKLSSTIIDKYIESNENIFNLIYLKQIIDIYKNNYNDFNLKNDINKKINESIINLIKSIKQEDNKCNDLINEIIELLYFTDKDKKNLNIKNYILDNIQKELEYEKVKDILLKLSNKYIDITDETKKSIGDYLILKRIVNIELILDLLKSFNNIKEFIISNIDNNFIIKERKFLQLKDLNENDNYKLLKGLIELKIFEQNQYEEIPYIKNTIETINKIKDNIESFNYNFDELKKIYENKDNESNLKNNRFFIIYSLNEEDANNKYSDLKNKYIEINTKIDNLELVNNYFTLFFKNSYSSCITEINDTINKIKKNNLSYFYKEIEKKQYQNYIVHYETAKEVLMINNSKFFHIIYNNKKLTIKEDQECLLKSLNELTNFGKLFKNKELLETDEKLIKFCIKNIDKNDLNNEIDLLNEIYNNKKEINKEDIIKKMKLFSKRKYIFKAIDGIKAFIENLNPKKTEYTDKINNILLNKDKCYNNNCDINNLQNIIDDLQKLNVDINDDKDNEYIKILIKLSKEPKLIPFLFKINNNYNESLIEKQKNIINNINKCSEFIKKMGKLEELKDVEDKNLIELFKKIVKDNKGILNNFKELKNNNFFSFMKNYKNLDDVLNSLFYLGTDIILFLTNINDQKDIILNHFKNDTKKRMEIINYIVPKKEDDLIELNNQINLLIQNEMINYIKFSPSIFDKYNELSLELLNTIINSLKSNDNKKEWNQLIHDKILNLVKNGKLKNKELLDMIQKDDIYIIQQYNDLLSLDILDGIDIYSLDDEFFTKWKSMNFEKIFKSKINDFYKKICSFIKDIKNFKLLFSFFNNLYNKELNNQIENKFKEILIDNKKNINIDDLVELILFLDKNKIDTKKFIFEEIQKGLGFIFVKDVFIKLEKEKDLSEESKDLITKFLTQTQSADILINLIKECDNIKDKILTQINKDYILKKEKLLEINDNNENEKYILLKGLLEEKIFNEDKFNKIPYIKQTNEAIKNIKHNIESFEISFEELNKIIDEKNIEKLRERFLCIYSLEQNIADEKLNKLISKIGEIKEKINEFELIYDYLNTFFQKTYKRDIYNVKNIISKLKTNNLKYADTIDSKNYSRFKDNLSSNKSKFFNLIYNNKKSKIDDEEKCLQESLNDFKNFEKIFNDNSIFDIDVKLLKFCLNEFNNKYNNEELKEEINTLNKIFNNNKGINNITLINNMKLISKRNFIFKSVKGIKYFIETLRAKKTDYYNNLCSYENKKDLNYLQKYVDKLSTMNIDIYDDKNNNYIKIINTLHKKPEIILFLFNINNFNNIGHLKKKEDINKINCIKNCSEFIKILEKTKDLKNIIDKELIESFKNIVNDNKDVLKYFKELIKNNYLYESLFNNREPIFKDLILSKELVFILLEKANCFNDILNSLFYLEKDPVLFFKVLNEKNNLILKHINKDIKKKIDINNYIKPKKEDNLNEIYNQINLLCKKEIKNYIKFSPSMFDIYIDDKNPHNTETINNIINSLKVNDNMLDCDNYIQKNILKLIHNKKLKNDGILNTIKKYNIFNNEKYGKNISVDMLNGVEITSLNERILNEWKNIYKYKKDDFYKKITSLINDIKDFEKLFSLINNKNDELYKYVTNKIKEIILNNIDKKKYNDIIEYIYFVDKHDENLKTFIIEEMNKKFDNKKINDIYIKLTEKYEQLKPATKQLIVKHLTSGDNSNTDFLLDLIEKCHIIKIDILSNIDNKFIIKDEKFLDLDDNDENDNYKLLKGILKLLSKENILEHNEIDYIRQTNENINKVKNNIENNNFDKQKLDKVLYDDRLSERTLCIYLLDETNRDNNLNNLKYKIKKIKIIKGLLFFLIIPILVSLIIFFIINNSQTKEYELNEINWDVFNISKGQARLEEKKYDFIEVPPPSKQVKNLKKSNEKIVVGIDFGAINSGYSYTIDNEIAKIDYYSFNKKVPNEIEISRISNKGQKYSYKASNSLKNYRKEELDKIYFIKGIKTIFSLDKLNNDNLCYIYPSEYVRDFNITNIIKEYLILLKNDIIEKINKPKIDKNSIKWVISVPSIWREFEKQIILNAAYESGINNIKLIYENEAASLSMLNDKYIDNNLKKKNNVFMLIDASGYYTNITINEIVDKDAFKEKIKIENNILKNVGILPISEEIINILEQILGKYYIDKMKREKPGEWIITLGDIYKAIEETYCVDGIEIYEINLKSKSKGQYEYLYNTEKGTNKYIIEYNQFSLILPGGLIGNIINKNVKYIVSKVNDIINEMKSKNIHIDSIMITGGLSKNKIFKNEIEHGLKSKIPIKYLTSHENAISKGAVIYGINPDKIKSRICPTNIGIGQKEKNIEVLIKKGEEFTNYSIVRFIKSTSDEQEIIQLNIYISENNDILSEKDFMGRLLIYTEHKKDRIIQLTINYDTMLTFSAIDIESQKEMKTKFEFFK